MKLTEVRRNAFAMPLNDPAYPPGPYKFYNRDFMLGPGWKEGCVGCSFGADHMGCLVHLEHDYHVSFTPEELAKGEIYYNYQMTDGGMEA
jgi:predicted dithiol-disulfide oxidoreductase (DUF899 family)